MPRGPRLDAPPNQPAGKSPGVLQQVMVRGVERRAIARDDRDHVDHLLRDGPPPRDGGPNRRGWRQVGVK